MSVAICILLPLTAVCTYVCRSTTANKVEGSLTSGPNVSARTLEGRVRVVCVFCFFSTACSECALLSVRSHAGRSRVSPPVCPKRVWPYTGASVLVLWWEETRTGCWVCEDSKYLKSRFRKQALSLHSPCRKYIFSFGPPKKSCYSFLRVPFCRHLLRLPVSLNPPKKKTHTHTQHEPKTQEHPVQEAGFIHRAPAR